MQSNWQQQQALARAERLFLDPDYDRIHKRRDSLMREKDRIENEDFQRRKP